MGRRERRSRGGGAASEEEEDDPGIDSTYKSNPNLDHGGNIDSSSNNLDASLWISGRCMQVESVAASP